MVAARIAEDPQARLDLDPFCCMACKTATGRGPLSIPSPPSRRLASHDDPLSVRRHANAAGRPPVLAS